MKIGFRTYFYVAKDILNIEHCEEVEDYFIIPLKRTSENERAYDRAYYRIGQGSGFFNDITCSSLNLIVKLNVFDEMNFSLSADYVEFRLENIPDKQLGHYHNTATIVLSDEELVDIYPTLLSLFNDLDIDDLRKQVAMAIPKIHMEGTKLFAERLCDNEYRSVWVTDDFKRCVLGLVENCVDKGGLVKAYILG